MRFLEQDLYDMVSDSLYETAWRAKLPINPSISVRSFLNAVNKSGIATDIDEENVNFIFSKGYGGIRNNTHIKLNFDQILEGWKRFPAGSFSTLVDSACIVHDHVKDILESEHGRNSKEVLEFSETRIPFYREVREEIEKLVKPYFSRFQEKVLIPSSGIVVPLADPWIIHLVLKNFDLDTYRKSAGKQLFRGCFGSPCVETLIEEKDLLFDNNYFPSKNVLADLFWGKYLDAFTRLNRYPLWQDSSDPQERLRNLTVRGFDALKVLSFEDHPGPKNRKRPLPLDL